MFNELHLAILVALLLCAWGAISTLQTTATRGEKIFWLTLLLVLPGFGFLVWFTFGPGAKALPGFARDRL